MEHRLMSEHEKAAIYLEAHRLHEDGRIEEAVAMKRSIPMPAFLAKVAKEKFGADILIKGGWNLTEAEAEYGSGWLNS